MNIRCGPTQPHLILFFQILTICLLTGQLRNTAQRVDAVQKLRGVVAGEMWIRRPQILRSIRVHLRGHPLFECGGEHEGVEMWGNWTPCAARWSCQVFRSDVDVEEERPESRPKYTDEARAYVRTKVRST